VRPTFTTFPPSSPSAPPPLPPPPQSKYPPTSPNPIKRDLSIIPTQSATVLARCPLVKCPLVASTSEARYTVVEACYDLNAITSPPTQVPQTLCLVNIATCPHPRRSHSSTRSIVDLVNFSQHTVQASTGVQQAQASTGKHRQAQASTGKHRQAQASTGKHRQTQANTGYISLQTAGTDLDPVSNRQAF